ncbi:MAG: hypothetical protein GF381_02185 [Candidatus Pacebacteria bacterium]|nr:hypothetical protein [Candidatus Paceibacterota bacterium]
MGTTRNVDMSVNPEELEKIKNKVDADGQASQNDLTTKSESDSPASSEDQTGQAKPVHLTKKRGRSKKYQAVRSKVDRTKEYDPFSAIELVKKLSYTKFEGTITAHLAVREQGMTADVAFPHSRGRDLQIEIADDKTLEKLEKGEIDFDILLAKPEFMPKITKYAPLLGPQGLMPNPKNGTLTPNPEQKKKELQAGKITIKTERKAPIMHVVIGSTEMETKALLENLQTLINSVRNKLKKVTLAATMSPGVKVDFEKKE